MSIVNSRLARLKGGCCVTLVMMPKELKRDEWGANAVAEAQLRNWNREYSTYGYEGLKSALKSFKVHKF